MLEYSKTLIRQMQIKTSLDISIALGEEAASIEQLTNTFASAKESLRLMHPYSTHEIILPSPNGSSKPDLMLPKQIAQQILDSSYEFAKAPWFRKFIESDAQTALSPAQSLPYQYSRFAEADTRYFSYAWKISDYQANKRHYIFIMDIPAASIHTRFQLNPKALDDPIMKLTLQPLIENAIYHGLEDKRTGGCLTISIDITGNLDEIIVKDNGIGMNPAQLAALQAKMSDQMQDNAEITTGHIGISNVYKWLKLRFGKDCEMQISSESGIGTTILLRLPRINSVPF